MLVQITRPDTTALYENSDEVHRALLSRRELLGLTFLWFALNFQFAALLPIVIPAQILLFVAPGAAGNAQQALFLGGLAALGAITAVILQPIVGAISDRTWSRLGRRRPYVLAGAIIMLAGLALLAVTRMMAFYIAGLFLIVVANTVSGTAYQGLVPDRVPAKQRGTASGYMGFMTILGTIGSMAVASLLLSQGGQGHSQLGAIARGASIYYGIAALVLIVGVSVTLFGVRESPRRHERRLRALTEGEAPARSGWLERLHHLWVAPWRHANFTWVFLTRGFVMLGLALFMTYIEYYFVRVAHVAGFVQATALNAILALAGAVCSALVLGVVSDRMRRVPIVSISTACMALAALAFVVAPGLIPLWPLGILFGLGYGAYMSVDVALAIDALPSQHDAGKDLGLWSIASTLPAVIAPLIGSMVIFLADRAGVIAFGYRAVFGLATVCLTLGAVLVLKVRETHTASAQASARAYLHAPAGDHLPATLDGGARPEHAAACEAQPARP